jgi:RimJ/RimL family protein N-acetyltransferase
MVILTPRLRLRLPSVDEAADALILLTDPDTARWNPAPQVTDVASAAAWCARGADWSGGDHATWSLIARDTGEFCGNVSIHGVNAQQRDAEIGYRIMPRARRRGLATEAVTAASAWAFENLALVRIELVHAVANPGSCAVAIRSGYPREGVKRWSYTYGDGQRYDEHLHARLATDPYPDAGM